MTPELHLFIIWANAQDKKQMILKDLSQKFSVIEIINIKWDQDNFSNNITRFYGKKLPAGSFKEIECGTGRFTLVTLLDHESKYEYRSTSKGIFEVNQKMFDAKELYRQWTGGGHKIHATNTPEETRHDLVLLLGVTYKEYMERHISKLKNNATERYEDRNLTGCIQWKSLTELFDTLNETSKYLVLRNFHGMPDTLYEDEHGDIDILVTDKEEVIYLLNATPVSFKSYRVHYKVNINYQTIRFDVRFVGDGYYDHMWQKSMLENRVLYNGFYIPSDSDYKYSLLYHALIHKKIIADDYKEKFCQLGIDLKNSFETLQTYMQENNYSFEEPIDLSVYFNHVLPGKKPSTTRFLKDKEKRLFTILSGLFTEKQKRFIKKIASKYL